MHISMPYILPTLCRRIADRGQTATPQQNKAVNHWIGFKQHHRALCDAEAAAQLLLIVNEKRAERLAAD